MTFNEESLRKGIQFGLGSKGIWTPELEDEMVEEIKSQALSQVAVSGWVATKDFMPENNKYVLAYTPFCKYKCAVAFWNGIEWRSADEKDIVWNVAFWQELPKPPCC